jgi:hypothetical protein
MVQAMFPTRQQEIDDFKRRINLTEYAAAQGYALDRKECSRNSVTMRYPGGDKIIVGKDSNSGHWIYFSVRDDADNGTIIDFIQNRQRLDLGGVRKELRPWVRENPNPPRRPPQASFVGDVEPITRDLARIRAQFAAMRPVQGAHPYLERERRIPAAVLADPRFAGKVYTDQHGNAVFPHHDRDGLCGFELRNARYKGFAKGGQKGLWYSAHAPDDRILVITESAIESLSYHAIHRPEGTRYFSIAGEMNPAQRQLLQSAFLKLPPGATVRIATNHDVGGRHLAGEIKAIALATSRADLALTDSHPEREGADWNDVLRAAVGQRREGDSDSHQNNVTLTFR